MRTFLSPWYLRKTSVKGRSKGVSGVRNREVALLLGEVTPVTAGCAVLPGELGAVGSQCGSEPLGGVSSCLLVGLAFQFVLDPLMEQVVLATSPAELGCPLQLNLHPWG